MMMDLRRILRMLRIRQERGGKGVGIKEGEISGRLITNLIIIIILV